MTDHNLASLPTLDLLGMLYSAQANMPGGLVLGFGPVFAQARPAHDKLPT